MYVSSDAITWTRSLSRNVYILSQWCSWSHEICNNDHVRVIARRCFLITQSQWSVIATVTFLMLDLVSVAWITIYSVAWHGLELEF